MTQDYEGLDLKTKSIDYLYPDVPSKLPWFELPLVKACNSSLKNYGELVENYKSYPIEIVTWPQLGRRPIDSGTGNEAGTVSGNFNFWWEGDYFYGKNNAIDDQYLFGWSKNPCDAKKNHDKKLERKRVLIWHVNYHPDGGQLFYPLDGLPYVVPLALPGDDVKPSDFVAFYVDGGKGLYIHPYIWHEGVFPLAEKANFYDRQGRVHARVSCNLAVEFGVFLSVPLKCPV